METKNVWLVTGASKGLGLALVKKLLADGYPVAATSRDVNGFQDILTDHPKTFLPVAMQITDEVAVKAGITKVIEHFGKIDVVVNNAGYGQLGTIEELSAKEAEENFSVNVYGTLNVLRHTLPYLRKQGSGVIFNIYSTGGLNGEFPGWGVYCATKFAVAGLTESLAKEVEPLGIRACVVYPGYFRTDFLSTGSLSLPENPIADYTAARELEKIHLEKIAGNQPNDPEKAAEVLLALSKKAALPVHLLLGQDCYDIVNQKIAHLSADMEKWKSFTVSTSFSS